MGKNDKDGMPEDKDLAGYLAKNGKTEKEAALQRRIRSHIKMNKHPYKDRGK